MFVFPFGGTKKEYGVDICSALSGAALLINNIHCMVTSSFNRDQEEAVRSGKQNAAVEMRWAELLDENMPQELHKSIEEQKAACAEIVASKVRANDSILPQQPYPRTALFRDLTVLGYVFSLSKTSTPKHHRMCCRRSFQCAHMTLPRLTPPVAEEWTVRSQFCA